MKLKVEFNDGYAFVDGRYFSFCSGRVLFPEDWSCTQNLNVYYRKDVDKDKIEDVLLKIKNITQEPLQGA